MKLFRTIEAVADGNYTVGDVIDFTLNDGEEVQALAVKQEDGGMLFVLLDCLADEECMNEENSNRGGFIASDLCAKLNGAILDRFPAEIREKMVPFSNGLTLRLPTEKEIFGKNEWGKEEGDAVQQWEPMKQRRYRIAFQGKNGAWEWYWLANQMDGSAANFAFVGSYGRAGYNYASYANGVRPAFKISNP